MSSEPSDKPPWMPPLEGDAPSRDAEPEWDQDDADGLVGQYALIGVTYLASDGETVESEVQYHGRIVSADRNSGIKIECEGKCAGQTFNLPPHTQVFQAADPGTYELRSTGETVENPDVLATWSVTARATS
jgi:hypothetical protein